MNPGSSLPLSCSICSASVYTNDGCLKGGAVAFIYSEIGGEVGYTVKLSKLWVKFIFILWSYANFYLEVFESLQRKGVQTEGRVLSHDAVRVVAPHSVCQ
jgi:hypothetical protein